MSKQTKIEEIRTKIAQANQEFQRLKAIEREAMLAGKKVPKKISDQFYEARQRVLNFEYEISLWERGLVEEREESAPEIKPEIPKAKAKRVKKTQEQKEQEALEKAKRERERDKQKKLDREGKYLDRAFKTARRLNCSLGTAFQEAKPGRWKF